MKKKRFKIQGKGKPENFRFGDRDRFDLAKMVKEGKKDATKRKEKTEV